MLNRLFGANTHSYLLTFGLCVLALGVPINKIVMSLAMIFLALNFLLEGEFKTKWQNLVSNKSFLFVFAFFVLHLVGILWSDNIDYAFHDIRVKIPILVIPLIIIAKPPKNINHLNAVLIAFIASTLISSLINFMMYQSWIGNHKYDDIRGLSLFGSHIRYGVIVSMCVAILISFLRKQKYRWASIILIAWFSFYTMYSQVLSGVITLITVVSFYGVYLIWQKKRAIAISLVGIMGIAIISLFIWIFKPMHIDITNYQALATETIEGNPYTHEFDKITPETGAPTNIYICNVELDREWPKYSTLHLDSLDLIGQPLRKTLIRYLSTKNLRKDAEGLKHLTKNEIRSIEMGHASVIHSGIMARLYGIKHQLNNANFPNNHSILERIEYWKAGISIIKSNWLIGVGTGDIQDEFNKEYDKVNSLLEIENRHRTHNMYLTVFVTFGAIGLLLFCLMLFKFATFTIKNHLLIGWFFILISIVSFIPEDSLETQTGVTFFAKIILLNCYSKG